MPTTSEHIAAREDADLLARLIAKAEQNGVPLAADAVRNQLGRLVSAPITVGGQATSVTAVHAYADAVRREYLAAPQAMAPGLNPGAVTDEHLAAALAVVFTK